MEILRWSKIGGQHAFHAARHVRLALKPVKPHGHDFSEIFWITSGLGTHRVNGATHPLQVGSLVFIRPGDCHGIDPALGHELRLTNIAFPREVARFFQHRHFSGRRSLLSPAGRYPVARQVDPTLLAHLDRWADDLAQSPRESLHLDRFLLNLLVDLGQKRPESLSGQAPEWLATACREIQQPENFAQGVEHFFRLCGHTREHVARTVRRHLKRTPTEHVNLVRMQYARRQLETGTQGILELALDCGIQNLSHFYTLFHAHAGTTPKNYRRQYQKSLAATLSTA